MEKNGNKFEQDARFEQLSPALLYLFLLNLIASIACVKSAIIETRENIKNINGCDAILLTPDLSLEYTDAIFEEFGITSWDALKIEDVINKCSLPGEGSNAFEDRLIRSIKGGNPAASLLMDKVISDISDFEAKERLFYPTNKKELALKDIEDEHEKEKAGCENAAGSLKNLDSGNDGLPWGRIALAISLKTCLENADAKKNKSIQKLADEIKKYNENPYGVIRERRLQEDGLTEAELKNNISKLPPPPKHLHPKNR